MVRGGGTFVPGRSGTIGSHFFSWKEAAVLPVLTLDWRSDIRMWNKTAWSLYCNAESFGKPLRTFLVRSSFWEIYQWWFSIPALARKEETFSAPFTIQTQTNLIQSAVNLGKKLFSKKSLRSKSFKKFNKNFNWIWKGYDRAQNMFPLSEKKVTESVDTNMFVFCLCQISFKWISIFVARWQECICVESCLSCQSVTG